MAYRKRAPIALTALADPTRRAVFERVAARPSPVGAVAHGLPVSRPAVSQHLRALKQAGLVTEAAAGNRRIYRIDPRGIAAMREWLEALWSAALDAFKDLADAETEEDPSP